jgi:hypothetical protein
MTRAEENKNLETENLLNNSSINQDKNETLELEEDQKVDRIFEEGETYLNYLNSFFSKIKNRIRGET